MEALLTIITIGHLVKFTKLEKKNYFIRQVHFKMPKIQVPIMAQQAERGAGIQSPRTSARPNKRDFYKERRVLPSHSKI